MLAARIPDPPTLLGAPLPPPEQLLPVLALVLAVGLFEAVFRRGWVQLRLEEAFGVLPALLLGAALYAAYHVGYGMSVLDVGVLLGIRLLYGAAFRITKSVLILWPLFLPMGQLYWIARDGLTRPLEATLGFIDVLAVMATVVWWVGRRRRRQAHTGSAVPDGHR